MNQKKVVLLAGLSPVDLGRCQGMITSASLFATDNQQEVLGFIQRNPQVAVINIDHFGGMTFLDKIKRNGFDGKIIPVTNKRSRPGESANLNFVTFREVPDAITRALA